MIEKYEKDNKIAVLVSYAYGIGWSTENKREIAWDKRVVEFYLQHKNNNEWMKNVRLFGSDEQREAVKYFESIGYPNVEFSEFNMVGLIWIKKGSAFDIRQFDGYEFIEFRDDTPWEIA